MEESLSFCSLITIIYNLLCALSVVVGMSSPFIVIEGGLVLMFLMSYVATYRAYKK